MKYIFSLLIVLIFSACGDVPPPEGLIISDGLPETTLLDIATTFDVNRVAMAGYGLTLMQYVFTTHPMLLNPLLIAFHATCSSK